MGIWVTNFDALLDFVTFVTMCAPNFPERDFLKREDQLNLDKAFDEIRYGMQFVAQKISDDAVLKLLWHQIDTSLIAYKAGDIIKGENILYDFQELIEKSAKRDY